MAVKRIYRPRGLHKVGSIVGEERAPLFKQPSRVYVSPDITPGLFLAVKAKKHVTVYKRRREAPGAGHPVVKTIFKMCAMQTKNIANRDERVKKIRECILAELDRRFPKVAEIKA